jgi:hypothetical protein
MQMHEQCAAKADKRAIKVIRSPSSDSNGSTTARASSLFLTHHSGTRARSNSLSARRSSQGHQWQTRHWSHIDVVDIISENMVNLRSYSKTDAHLFFVKPWSSIH